MEKRSTLWEALIGLQQRQCCWHILNACVSISTILEHLHIKGGGKPHNIINIPKLMMIRQVYLSDIYKSSEVGCFLLFRNNSDKINNKLILKSFWHSFRAVCIMFTCSFGNWLKISLYLILIAFWRSNKYKLSQNKTDKQAKGGRILNEFYL